MIVFKVFVSTVLDPVALRSISYQLKKNRILWGIIYVIPDIMYFICSSNSLSLAFTNRLMNSSIVSNLTCLSLPLKHNSISDPSDKRVTKFWSTANSNSSADSVFWWFLKSSITYHENVSMHFKSYSVGSIPAIFFQNKGGRSSYKDDVDLIAQPSITPRNLNISKWFGLLDEGFGIQHSLYWPWLFLLFGVLISNGKEWDCNSRQILVIQSLNGPPAS